MADIKDIKKFKNPFNYPQTGLILGLIGFLIYLSTSTQMVPNWDNESQMVIYSMDDPVPKSNVSINQAGLGILLVIMLAMSFVGEGGKKKSDRMTADEGRKLLNSYLKKKKDVRLGGGTLITIGEYHIDTNFLTRYKTDKTGTKMFRYVFQVRITDLKKLTHYLKGYVHPFDRCVDGFVKIDGPLEEKDE